MGAIDPADVPKTRDFRTATNDHCWPGATATGKRLLLAPLLPLRHRQELGLGHVLGPQEHALAEISVRLTSISPVQSYLLSLGHGLIS